MAQTGSAREARLDLLLGKVALERGLVTQLQLREALAEQALGVTRGRKAPRPIGAILSARKALTDGQVRELGREIEARIAVEEEGTRKDSFLGQILVDADLVAPKHVEECLLSQAEMFEQGRDPVPRLGEILVERGYASREDVEQALALQKAMVRVCSKCGKQCSLPGTRGGGDRCPVCQGPLEPLLTPGSLSGGGTGIRPAPVPPPEPKKEKDPSRLGKYAIRGILGRGGMGVVYEALDTQLNRTVALKLMHRDPGSDPKESSMEVERFVREAQVAARLRHPNIVSIYEAGVADGQHYIAMEHIEGLSMAQWRKSGSITIRQQVRILRDVALAVQAAHQLGVTHRDLKPQNVLIDPKGKPYVTDFGLAKKTGPDVSASLTVEGAILGTPTYMSPEQAKGRKSVSKRSDLWSLGIMLYEILAGRPPFRGETPIAILMKVLRDPVPPPSSVAPALLNAPLYRPLEGVCMRALQKDPGDRYGSAKDFADDLSRWLKGDEVRAAPRRTGAIPKWAAWAAGALLVALAIGAGIGLATRGSRPSKILAKAEEYLAQGDPDAARQLFERVLEREPGNDRAKGGLALAKSRLETRKVKEELDEMRTKGAGTSAPASSPVPPRPPVRESGVPHRWLLMGPFENRDNRGFETPFAPEAGIDLAAGAWGVKEMVSWRPAPAVISGAGSASLDFQKEFLPNEEVVAYALVHVNSSAAADAQLLVGSDDGVKVWVNGMLVHRNNVTRALKPDEDTVPCRLRAGWNRLLFKVTQGKAGFGLSLRVAGPPGLVFDPYGDLPGRPR